MINNESHLIEVVVYSDSYQQEVIDLILNIQQNEFHVPITLEDQPDLLTIPSFYQGATGVRRPLLHNHAQASDTKGNFWIATHEGKVVGTIALLGFSNDQAALRKMFVAKDFRGKELGTAQKLFDTLLSWSKEKGIREIYLGTLSHMFAAHSFYRRNGFVEMRKEELPENFPLVHVDSMFFKLKLESNSVTKL
ncbi:MAG TPA: GNAT family N-acetyltransferase [Chitinophagales bacterium]|nr:GNAT family N-acetyltransferase [Chitinophagales bacterium]